METTCLVNCNLSLELPRSKETFDDYFNRLKNEFYELMNNNQFSLYNGKKIILPKYGESDWYGLFYHLISESFPNKKEGIINYERLKRVLWFPKILFNNPCNKCKNYHKTYSLTKNNRMVIFCEQYNYVIACKEKDNYIIVITGYPVDRSVSFKYK